MINVEWKIQVLQVPKLQLMEEAPRAAAGQEFPEVATLSKWRSHGSQLPQTLDYEFGSVAKHSRHEQVGRKQVETASAPTPGALEKVNLLFLCHSLELASLLLRLHQHWQ